MHQLTITSKCVCFTGVFVACLWCCSLVCFTGVFFDGAFEYVRTGPSLPSSLHSVSSMPWSSHGPTEQRAASFCLLSTNSALLKGELAQSYTATTGAGGASARTFPPRRNTARTGLTALARYSENAAVRGLIATQKTYRVFKRILAR